MQSGLQTLPTELVLKVLDGILENHEEVVLDFAWETSWKRTRTFLFYENCYSYDTPSSWRRWESRFWQEMINVTKTCKRLYDIATPVLYRRDVEFYFASALFISCRKGIIAGVRRSLQQGADPNMLDMTHPVLSRDQRSHRLATRAELPPDTTLPTQLQLTPLHWAASCQHEDIVALLLEHGADCNSRANIYHPTRGTPTLLRLPTSGTYLFNHKFHHPLEKAGANPLFFALSTPFERYEADPGEPFYGQPSEQSWKCPSWKPWEEDEPRIRIARRLIEAGSSLITHKGYRIHALHQASQGAPSFVEYLVTEKGVNPNIRDIMGNTTFHHLVHGEIYMGYGGRGKARECRAIAKVLAAHGANPDALDTQGRTPMENAMSENALMAILSLVSAGAKLSDEILEHILDFSRRPWYCKGVMEIVTEFQDCYRGELGMRGTYDEYLKIAGNYEDEDADDYDDSQYDYDIDNYNEDDQSHGHGDTDEEL